MSSQQDAVFRLGAEDEPALSRLLDTEPVVNLFLRGFLDAHAVDRAWWYAIGDPLRSVALVLPARLCVPFATLPEDAALIGHHLRSQHRPTLLVGPRAASDALWSAWASTHQPRRRYDQRLYVLDSAPPGEDPPGFRRAVQGDVRRLAVQAAAMEREDLGTDPRERDPASHDQVVAERVRTGRTWVIEDQGAIVFQVNVGTLHSDGAQIGGIWVPPARRGRGLSTAGVAATGRHLLQTVPRITLHVNEANTPAVRCYERVGFRRDAAYRLVVP